MKTRSIVVVFSVAVFCIVLSLLLLGRSAAQAAPSLNASPPAETVRLIFIHHSTGENWLDDSNGQLGLALRDNNYFVSDTNYGWGPPDQDKGAGTIGDHTDIPDWYSWFTGPHHNTYLTALYAESDQHAGYSRLSTDPGGENTIVMFKSCFPNSNLAGNPDDPPADAADENSPLDVAHVKRIYIDALNYFAAHQDKLFVVITAPPLAAVGTDAAHAANARAFNNWLVDDWLTGYAYRNVAVFDFYTVLTSNGGNSNTNDLGWPTGNHHRYRNGAIDHSTAQGSNFSAYPTGDSHPSEAGNLKATGEFVSLLNIFYHRWQDTFDLSTSTQSASAIRVRAGDRVTFTLALRNAGSISATVYLTEVVPAGLAYVPNTLLATGGAYTATLAPTLRWSGLMPAAANVTITFAVTVTASTTQAIYSTAAIDAPGFQSLNRTAVIIVNGYAVNLPLMMR